MRLRAARLDKSPEVYASGLFCFVCGVRMRGQNAEGAKGAQKTQKIPEMGLAMGQSGCNMGTAPAIQCRAQRAQRLRRSRRKTQKSGLIIAAKTVFTVALAVAHSLSLCVISAQSLPLVSVTRAPSLPLVTVIPAQAGIHSSAKTKP